MTLTKKKPSITVLIQNSVGLKAKSTFHTDKSSIHQDIIINLFAIYTIASQYIKQKLTALQGELDKSTIIMEESNISLSVNFRINRQNVNKNLENVNNIINKV